MPRPKMIDEKRRGKYITVRFTLAEFNDLKRLAQRASTPIALFLWQIIIDRITLLKSVKKAQEE